MSANTPPERCPVCGADAYHQRPVSGVMHEVFVCQSEYALAPINAWVYGCPHAMTAALRTGATLHPTALEQARAALVDAADRLVEAPSYASVVASLERDLLAAAWDYVTAKRQEAKP